MAQANSSLALSPPILILLSTSRYIQLTMKVLVGIFASMAMGAQGASLRGEPEGLGVPEKTKGAACDECNAKAPWLKDCSCHATDVWGTFANDATKELTSAKGYGSTTENTGAKRLPEGWHWHCRPASGTEGVWQQC